MDADAVAEVIVAVADAMIVPRFGRLTDGEVEAKSPGDLVTIADREAEAALSAILRRAYPSALIVGEEAAFSEPGLVAGLADADQAWLIDPVDGTNNFVAGSPDFGVLVAELRRGVTVRGWIWQPIAGRMFVAEVGGGVRLNGSPLAATGVPHEPVRACVPGRLRRSPIDGYDLRPTMRCCAVDYPLLFSGEVDVLAYTRMRPWDHAAGVLMVTELGGLAALSGGTQWRPGLSGALLVASRTRSLWPDAAAALTRG
jgi:fructose-1,6-bisphosphatase/inositol monophosphatase family enzyme